MILSISPLPSLMSYGIVNVMLATLTIIFMALTLLILFMGIFTMASGGEFNQKYGNKMMVLRVVFQAITIGLLLLMFLLHS